MIVASTLSATLELAALAGGHSAPSANARMQTEPPPQVDNRFIGQTDNCILAENSLVPFPAASDLQVVRNSRPTPLAIISNDFDSASALALAQHKPILVCKGSRSNFDTEYFEKFVLRDTLLARTGDKAVVLSLNLENPIASHNNLNYALESFPVYFLFDAERKQLCGLLYSCPSAQQLARLLEQNCPLTGGLNLSGKGFNGIALENLVAAQQQLAAEDFKWASLYLDEVEKYKTKDWERYGEALLTRAFVLYGQGDDAGLLDFAAQRHKELALGSEKLNLARLLAHSSKRLELVDSNLAAWARSLVLEVNADIMTLKSSQSAPVLAGALELNARIYLASADSAAFLQSHAERATVLEQSLMACAASAEKACFVPPLVESMLILGKSEAAISLLKMAVQAEPEDYRYPMQLAQLISEFGLPKEALDYAHDALRKAQGLPLMQTRINRLISLIEEQRRKR